MLIKKLTTFSIIQQAKVCSCIKPQFHTIKHVFICNIDKLTCKLNIVCEPQSREAQGDKLGSSIIGQTWF